MQSEGRQMKQCWLKYIHKKCKNPPKKFQGKITNTLASSFLYAAYMSAYWYEEYCMGAWLSWPDRTQARMDDKSGARTRTQRAHYAGIKNKMLRACTYRGCWGDDWRFGDLGTAAVTRAKQRQRGPGLWPITCVFSIQYCTDKKENKIILIYIRKLRWEQLQSQIWLTASSYMGKYLRISSYIRKPFLINDFSTACSPLNFLIYEENFLFLF